MKGHDFSLMICLSVRAGSMLVVGGSDTAVRKVRTLVRAGFAVELVAPEIADGIESMADGGKLVTHRRKASREDFMSHAFAVIAMSRKDTEKVLPLAEGTGCRLDCCGAPELGTWSLAAQFSDGRFLVGTSSYGKDAAGSAALKRRLRNFMEEENKG